MKRIHDISLPLNKDTLLYPGDDALEIIPVSNFTTGSLYASKLLINCHLGTHVDAPLHFIPGGRSLDQLDIKHFTGPAIVFDVSGHPVIDVHHIQHLNIPTEQHILFKTNNAHLLSLKTFSKDYTWLTAAAAEYICSKSPLSFGFDYYSVDAFTDAAFSAHTVFAQQQLPVFACLDLRNIQPATCHFSALPLPIEGIEACPVRAVLWT